MIMVGRRSRAVVAAAVAVIMSALLGGCSGFGPPAGYGAVPTTESSMSAEQLAAAKKAARIADCPSSDAAVAVVGNGLPDITLPCLGGGREVRLAGLRGRPMMINIWAQWCEPCRAEARYLAAAAEELDGKVLMLGIDYSDPRPDWAIEFAAYAKWHYPQLADPDLALRAPLQLAGPPQTIFVDADGTIVYRHSGPFAGTDQITAAVAEHLGVRR